MNTPWNAHGACKDESLVALPQATNVPGAPVQVGTNPIKVLISPDNAAAYVLNQTSRDVSVIDASKTIINSNKKGDETFLMKFVDKENIKTLQDFTSSKDDLMDAVDAND